jgi:hypothetical protein
MVNHLEYKSYWIDIFSFNLKGNKTVTHGFISKEDSTLGSIFCSNETHAKQIIDSHTEKELINALGKNYAIYARLDFVAGDKFFHSFKLDNLEYSKYHKLSPSPDPYDIREWYSIPFCVDVNINCNLFDKDKVSKEFEFYVNSKLNDYKRMVWIRENRKINSKDLVKYSKKS